MSGSGIDTAHVMPSHYGLTKKFLGGVFLRKRLLILGDGKLGNNLARVLGTGRQHRYDVVGFLSLDPSRVGCNIINTRVIGTIEGLFELAEQYRVQTVAVCFEDRRGTMPMDTLLDVKAMGIEVVDGHGLYEEQCGRLSIDELKPSFLIFSSGFQRKPVVMTLKRVVDMLGSVFGLILLAPLLLIIALLVKLDSPGPILYRQTRIGHHGFPLHPS